MIAPGTKPYVLRRSKHKMPWTSRLASPDDGMFKSETEKLNVSLILHLKPKKFKPQRGWGRGVRRLPRNRGLSVGVLVVRIVRLRANSGFHRTSFVKYFPSGEDPPGHRWGRLAPVHASFRLIETRTQPHPRPYISSSSSSSSSRDSGSSSRLGHCCRR